MFQWEEVGADTGFSVACVRQPPRIESGNDHRNPLDSLP